MADIKKTRAIIDLDAIAHNYRYTKELCGGVRVAAVIKADAYGHGARAVAGTLAREGCDFFAVATIDEALELREGGVGGTVLVLGYVLDERLEEAVTHGISLAIDDAAHLARLSEIAAGRDVRVHLKIDTGMSRTGFPALPSAQTEVANALPPALSEAVAILKANPSLRCEGLFSHFAVADEADGEAFTEEQFERYQRTAAALEANGVHPAVRHICNSAGLLRFPAMRLDAVRLGVTLYGCGELDAAYRPCMTFKTVIVNIHTVKKGESVGYGRTYIAESDRRIAVIGAGYADGVKRCLSGRGYVLCHGKKAPFVGRICMDMAMVDVTDIPEAGIGDDAVIFGTDGNAVLSADEVARFADTISYEILCAVSARVPRIYRKDGQEYSEEAFKHGR